MADNKTEIINKSEVDAKNIDTKVETKIETKVAEVAEVEQPKPTFPDEIEPSTVAVAAPKVETLDDKIEKMVSSVVNGLLPGLIAAIRTPVQTAKNVVRACRENDKCNECQQLKSACQGEHMKMVCYPTRYTKTGDYFRGCGLNGVWYLSNNENHFITIPKSAYADFQRMIKNYEEREVASMSKRTGSWDFGTIGQGGKAKMPNPAKMGW